LMVPVYAKAICGMLTFQNKTLMKIFQSRLII
jgi:hypothetical protein